MTVIAVVIALALVGADQLIKRAVVLRLKPIGIYPVIDGLFSLAYVENRGMAFGFLHNFSWVLVPLTILGSFFLVLMLRRYQIHSRWSRASLTLLFAGGVGNLVDRLFRGYVVDYLSVHFFPFVFNLADCCVVIGGILLVIAVFRSDLSTDASLGKKDRSKSSKAAADSKR